MTYCGMWQILGDFNLTFDDLDFEKKVIISQVRFRQKVLKQRVDDHKLYQISGEK